MALTYNEGKTCDAVVQVLEAREGKRRSNVRRPEEEGHAAPIELAFNLGDQLFALEHTGIEPFAGHMQMEAQAEWLFRPVEAALVGKLPPNDTFELSIPLNAMRRLRRNDLAQTHAALASWVEATAPTLPIAPYGTFLGSIKPVLPPGVPFSVRLYRFQTIVPLGRFRITHVVSEQELEPSREQRICTSCAKKFPKLEIWRHDAKARTVLVLEDNDIQLTNAARVCDTLRALKSDFNNWPDEIYLVTTIDEKNWWVHALKVGDRDYYQLSQADQCLWEFDPDRLVDLTP